MTVNSSTDNASFTLERTTAAINSARRAAVTDRYAANSLAVEWRPLVDLQPIVDEWRELAGRALDPNVFYEPAFALAAAALFGRDAGAVLVWSGTSPRKLLGFFPGRIERRRYGVKLPVLVGWTHAYAPLGVPLVEREAAEPVIAAWLAHLAADPALPKLLLLPFLPEDGPFAAALGAVLRRAQMPAADFNRHRRAALAPPGERSRYIDDALGSRKLKELRRVARRLGERGALLFTSATELAAVDAAIEEFFVLEARGWKGKAGTAAACRDDISGFIKAALNGLAVDRKVTVNRILIDGQPIAATVILRSAEAAWFWKVAYDESFSRYSPGFMLTVVITEQLLDDATMTHADSCATANHPMIDHVWREQLSLCDCLVSVRPQAAFAFARRLEYLRGAAIAVAKAIRKRLYG